MRRKLIGLIFVLVLSFTAASQARIIYVDATEGAAGNTKLAAGGTFTTTTDASGADNLWRGRAFANGGTIFESGGQASSTANTEDCPRLVTTVNVPEGDYEVFVYFWADASQWRIQAALADAAGDLPLFPANDPNGAATKADANDFAAPVPMLTEGNRTLWQMSLGTTGVTRTINVYIDDAANHLTNNARTWYDGIGLKALPPKIVYADATEGEAGNTKLAAGGTFTTTTDASGADNLWRGRAFANAGTIFESGGQASGTANTEDCPRLVTTVNVPENDYEVFVYFWADASQWRIQAALADAAGDLPLFTANDPNGAAKTAVPDDFAAPVPLLTEGNRTLWQAYLGTTGFTTAINVFVDDDPNHLTNNARTWYDGIGYKVVAPKIYYVDVTEGEAGNTKLAAGGTFKSTTDGSGADNLWRGRVFANAGTIFESGGQYGETANPEDCPRLMTSVAVPENDYEAYVYFWADPGPWRIQASLANMTGDLPLFMANDPNSAATVAVADDFAAPVPLLTEGNRTLWQAPLGTTGLTKTIDVFVDDAANHLSHTARTWYDGIGFKAVSLYEGEPEPEPNEPEPNEPEPEPLPEPVDPGTAGLVAYYPFENDANDNSGNGLHGTIVGDPVFVQGPAGHGMALDFSNDYVDCGNSPLFNVTEQLTVAAWVNMRSVPGEWRAVITKGDGAWRISTNAATQGLHFGFEDGTRGWQAANSKTVLALNEWHHVCATYDLTNGARIYIDGRLDGTNADKQGITLDTYNVYIGENSQQAGRFWDGLIDEVVIYNRALSPGEVVYLAVK